MELSRTLAAKVARLRQERGWSVRDLANRASMTHPTVLRIEEGFSSPGINNVAAIAQAFGVTVAELLGEAEPEAERLLPGWQFLDTRERQHVRELVRTLAAAHGAMTSSRLRAAEERAPYLGANADAVADARRESERLSESEDRDREDGGEQRQRRRGGR